MTVPTPADAPLPHADAARADATRPDDVPDPVLETAPTSDPEPGEEVDEVLDVPEPAPGFPPAPGGTPGLAQPPQRLT